MRLGNSRGIRPDDRAVIHCIGRGRRPIRTTSDSVAAATRILTATVTAAWLASAGVAAVRLDLPGPLDGPGHPELRRRDAKRIEKATNELGAGDLAAATRASGKADDSPARRLIDLQIRMAGTDEPPIEDLQRLCGDQPDYAAAWVTLAQAAEQSGAEAIALAAARRGGELWPDSRWAAVAGDLEQRWITTRVSEARSLAEAGRPGAGLELVDAALALAPEDHETQLTKADLLVDLDRFDDAELVLRAMGDDPAAMMRRARLAEGRGDLAAAMALYGAVPAGYSDRDANLRRVQLAWRRQNLPITVQEALASTALTRAQLAEVLVGLVPEANALGGGQVPLLSDIVELPSQREILTAVRIGLMNVDLVEHLFHPERMVEPAEVRYALDRLNGLLDRRPPPWCDDGESNSSDCVELTSPVSGAEVADIVLRTSRGEAP